MKKLSLFCLLFISILSFAQDIYEKYPDGQIDYIGGNVQFYKDFHQVLIDKKLQPCSDKNEILDFRIVVYPDKTVKYVKPEFPISVEENKCTFELSKEVAKYLKGWNPAEVDGKKVAALTSFWIIPNELFSELKDNYDAAKDYDMATYEGGINNFRKKVFQSIDISRFTFSGEFRLVITFEIQKDGSVSDVLLAESSSLKEFDEMVLKSIKSIRNRWTPAKIHGIPVNSHFRLPLVFKRD